MSDKISIVAFLLIVSFQVLFISLAVLEKANKLAVFVFFVFTMLLMIYAYSKVLNKIRVGAISFIRGYHLILGGFAGAVATYYLSINLGLGPVIAAGLVGTLVSFLSVFKNERIGEIPAVAYCGAFVGMSSSMVLENLLVVSLAGLVAGIVFVIAKNVFGGIGGKLGTMAFISVAITVFLTSIF
ncbi:MAG: hypothetical protein ABH856_02770 [Patescibacteria group bacterium]|nr:hypothetical protein [Patescibacteria group bacterium]